jgi:oxalate decarboxylase/phosphoglucose isomerase-like protein (cupin superfamily)
MRRKYDLTPTGTPKLLRCAPTTIVNKGWGRKKDGAGEVFAYHVPDEHPHHILNVETVKLLHIQKGKRLSRHFHVNKREIFVLACGHLKVEIWDPNGVLHVIDMVPDTKLIIEPGWQHRMTGVEENNILVEVSTLDRQSDSYRIEKGD